MNDRTLNLILTHQDAPRVERMLDWWQRLTPTDSLVLAYGGPPERFKTIDWQHKMLIQSNRLRTQLHHREMQSYTDIFHQAIEDGFIDGFQTVHFAEYDQIPVQPDLNARQRAYLKLEGADVLGYRLQRIDKTNDGHFLNHWRLPEFRSLLERISVRSDPSIVLSMLGFGSFWTSEAFRAVAEVSEPVPLYLEVFLPTIAHHLGFRVLPVPDQRFASHVARDFSVDDLGEAARAGQWNVHPVKWLWDEPLSEKLRAFLDSITSARPVSL